MKVHEKLLDLQHLSLAIDDIKNTEVITVVSFCILHTLFDSAAEKV